MVVITAMNWRLRGTEQHRRNSEQGQQIVDKKMLPPSGMLDPCGPDWFQTDSRQ